MFYNGAAARIEGLVFIIANSLTCRQKVYMNKVGYP